MKTSSGLVQGEQLIKYDVFLGLCYHSGLLLLIMHSFLNFIYTLSHLLSLQTCYFLLKNKSSIQGLQSFFLNVKIKSWVILKVVLHMFIIILK